MKLSKSFILSIFALLALSIYLFTTAPPPLKDNDDESHTVPVQIALQILEEENDIARNLYTKSIVGAGKKQKIKFDEDWEEEEIIAGPLPAQFMRLTAISLEHSPLQLGLFLGSDYAINKANDFEGEQRANFQKVKETRKPVFFYSQDSERYAYMAPDIASVKPCVTCHNDHEESPKTDWKLNDVMGAATWTYPKENIGYKELLDMIAVLRGSFKHAYQTFLEEISTSKNPPIIGEKWPKDGKFVPSIEIFMDELVAKSSDATLKTLLLTTLNDKESSAIKAINES